MWCQRVEGFGKRIKAMQDRMQPGQKGGTCVFTVKNTGECHLVEQREVGPEQWLRIKECLEAKGLTGRGEGPICHASRSQALRGTVGDRQ